MATCMRDGSGREWADILRRLEFSLIVMMVVLVGRYVGTSSILD